MMEETIQDWHAYLRGNYSAGLDGLLHDDCIFYSPVVFTPQRGKELTKIYLNAAGATFSDDAEASAPREEDPNHISFRYTKEVVAGNTAILEFERTMGGKYVNGVDIITCDDDGKIIEFKVMIRPLQAVNVVHQAMGATLKKLEGSSADA